MTDQQTQYAGFLRRLAAYLIDAILVVVPSYFINILSFLLFKSLMPDNSAWTVADFLATKLPYYVMYISSLPSLIILSYAGAWFLAAYKWQATPGKRIMKVYVVCKDGMRITFKTGFLRSFLPVSPYLLSGLMIVLIDPYYVYADSNFAKMQSSMIFAFAAQLIGVIVWYSTILFTKEKTAVHDMILGTRVVRGRI